MIAEMNMYVHLKFGYNWTTNTGRYGKKSISPILLVVLILQIESQYLKNRKRYRSEFCTQVGSDDPMCSDLSKCL